jgi:hypothetical protein
MILAAAPASAAVSEDQAIQLVARAMTRIDKVPARCLAYDTESQTRRTFEIAVRETHARGCGGDPDVMPVIERFRVGRSPTQLWRYDVTNDSYVRCRVSRTRPACPKFDYEH